jgi:hypothetical protein
VLTRFLVALAIVTAGLTATSVAGSLSVPLVHIAFYGDSLTVEAANYIYPEFNSATTSVRINAVSGTALCDWVYPRYQTPGSRYTPGGVMQLSAKNAPALVVLQFTGNAYTPCIAPDAGSPAKIAENYAVMARVAIAHLLSIGTRFVVIDRGPISIGADQSHSPLPALLASAYQSVVASFHNGHVTYDAAADRSVLVGAHPVTYMPCLNVEVLHGECSNLTSGSQHGLNQVRSADGVHFCPDVVANLRGQLPALCDKWDSGAFRFALGFATSVWIDVPRSAPASAEPFVTLVSPGGGPSIGGTTLVVLGSNLSAVTAVQVVKFYNPVINGTALSASVPTRVFVPATHLRSVTATRLVVTAPALDLTTPPDPGWEFVIVFGAGAQSVTGIATQAFSEP